ncbi:MAG: NPCBM/NEW2 domain-containing protein [Verrucomicrobiales bacterium]|nr:NPCBM/NEW2 domain-containing protein [Verrucomicrobiales bacterium]
MKPTLQTTTSPRLAALLLTLTASSGGQAADPAFWSWAAKPPMGWNSWDCFATTVTEAQTKVQADYLADHLLSHGWEYVVVDIQWYEPDADSFNYRQNATLTMDDWGRLMPAPNRFPSAANGVGFKALADYVHQKGLKFGIHLMRGIPRQAVRENTPVKGTNVHARDIANPASICPWNPDMFGVDMTRPGAQSYYDSVFDLIASWGVDYVKVDDISRPYQEHAMEIEAVRRAIDQTGRPMVLSLSPGETALTEAEHVQQHANLWRISDDFWDSWPALYAQFERLRKWNPHRGPGHWPDADMLPLGILDLGRRSTRFTPDEQVTLMTLWSIARSPLMHGGDMTKMDESTLALLTNDEVLAVNQDSTGNRPLFHRGNEIAWVAGVPGSTDRYLAVFNAPEQHRILEEHALFASPLVTRETPGHGVTIDVDLSGARRLYLVATDGGDGNFADHVDWVRPRVITGDGERSLTQMKWRAARTGWQEVRIGRGAEGRPITVDGREYADGIGAHADSVIEYDLPEGTTRLKAFAALDDRGTRLQGGATVQFYVFTQEPFEAPAATRVTVPLNDLGFTGPVRVRDLWQHRNLGRFMTEFAPEIASHGAGLYRLSGVRIDYPSSSPDPVSKAPIGPMGTMK